MPRPRDEVAYFEASRRSALPDCLHVPVAAVDEAAISSYIGDIIDVISPGRALFVSVEETVERDLRLPIWQHVRSNVLFDRFQVWVAPAYTRYRPAYRKAKPDDDISGRVLAHGFNRRVAAYRGYGFVRLVSVARSVNSSSAATEQWGMQQLSAPLTQSIRYADLADLMVFLDMNLGGGNMDAIRVAQELVEVPNDRTAALSRTSQRT